MLALAACGGSDRSQPPEQRGDAARADALCAEVERATRELARPQTARGRERRVRQVSALIDQTGAQISDLADRGDRDAELRRYASMLRDSARMLRAQGPDALGSRIRTQRAAADGLGLRVCGGLGGVAPRVLASR